MDILHLETMSITVAVIFFSIFPYVRFHGQIRGADVADLRDRADRREGRAGDVIGREVRAARRADKARERLRGEVDLAKSSCGVVLCRYEEQSCVQVRLCSKLTHGKKTGQQPLSYFKNLSCQLHYRK